MKNKEIYVIVGHYGSGKTEFAVNLAVESIKNGRQTTIVDLDIVNPYFRTKDAQLRLEKLGAKVICPEFANTNLDLPALPADIYSVFMPGSEVVIFDVGGDGDGAVALGQYHRYFSEHDTKMYVVVNTKRPLTQQVDEIVEMVQGIEMKSRLKAVGIINNTNVAHLTTVEDILKGQILVNTACEKLDIPLYKISLMSELKDEMPEEFGNVIFPMERYLKIDWLM